MQGSIANSYNPIANAQQNNKPSLNVAKASAGIYTAAMQTGLSDPEKTQIENWAIIQNQHKELMRMGNAEAGSKFNKLDQDVKDLLTLYYGVDYSRRPEGAASSVVNKIVQGKGNDGASLGDLAKSPMRAIFAAGEEYGKVVNTWGRASLLQSQSQEIKLDSVYSNEAIFNQEYVEPLIQKYGGQRAFVAMSLLKGMTPGEIIDAWGPNDAAMLDAIGEAFDGSDQFTAMVGEFERSQLSRGRMVGHKVNEALNINAEDHPWLWKMGTGSIDLAWQLAIDPMTYLTGGVAPLSRMAAGRATKLLESAGGVQKHFAKKDVQELWTNLSKGLDDYSSAVKSGETTKATELRMNLKNQYPQYVSDTAIEFFTKAKYSPETGQTVAPITDLASAEAFFTAAENTSMLVRGRVDGIKYYNENIPTMRFGRNFKTGARLRTREFFKGKQDFKDFEDGSLDDITNGLLELGEKSNGIDKSSDANVLMNLIDEKRKKGIRGKIDYLSARHPGDKAIYSTDEKYAETLDLVRQQALIATGDKRMSEAVAIKFANLDEKSRIALRKGIDEATLRRIGLDKVSGGQEFMQKILTRKYAVAGEFSATDQLVLPARATSTGEIGTTIPVNGTLLPFQNTSALGSLPWTEIRHFMAGKTGDRTVGLVQEGQKGEAAAALIGGAYQNRHVEMLTDLWTTFTLAPRLGIRTAIDEGMMFSLYMTTGMAKEFLNAKRAGNVIAAASGSVRSVGPVKNAIQGALSKFPGISVGATRAISKETKDSLQNKYEDQAMRGEIEFHEVDGKYQSELIDVALEAKGKRLPENHKAWLKEAILLNPRVLEDVSSAQFADVIGSLRGNVLPEQSLLNESQLTQSINAWRDPNKPFDRASVTDQYTLQRASEMEKDKLYLAMFHNFITAFATRPYKLSNDKLLSPAAIFFRHDGLQTSSQWAAAKSEFMQTAGFADVGNGKFIVVDEDLARNFLSQSRQNLDDGRALEDVASEFADASLTELTHRFHGGGEQINSDFVNYINTRVDDQGRNIPSFAVARDMDFETYKSLVGNNTAELVRTPLDFGPPSTNLGTWAARVGMDKIFSYMTRTTDDLFRQPVVHSHYFVYRQQNAPLQARYKQELSDGMKARYIAEGKELSEKNLAYIDKRSSDISSRYFTEHSMEDAVHHTLKYSDNPNVRTIFAHNVRTIGRFYRAVEDFHRRIYRLVGEKGIDAVFRARLMSQGLSAIGSTHQDEDGQRYLVMPMDDAVFHAVDTVLSQYPGWEGSGVRQPLFNEITFKLSAGNPSFQDDAGVPYLSGPMASLSILGVQYFLGKFDVTKEAGAKLDNLALGNIGDNMDLKKAILPRSLSLIWESMSYDEQDQQEVSAAMQAISYNQANGYGIYPEDYTTIDANGVEVMDQDSYLKALTQYQKDVQITAHNVLWLRNILGLISPIGPQLKETKDLPGYLKDVGLSSMRSSFFDVLDDVERMYPAADSHYEMALALWTGQNKGKLAYIPSRNEQSVVTSYSQPMQDWILQNQKAVDTYGAAAVMFAPKVGDFSPGVYNWAKAADLISLKPLEDYLDEVTLQDSINVYFDIDDEETAMLEGITDPAQRKAILDLNTAKKRNMKIQVPTLEARVANLADNEEKTKFLSNVFQVANDPDVDVDPEVRDAVNTSYDVYKKFLSDVNSDSIVGASNSTQVKRALKDQALEELNLLAKEDESGIVKELIRNSFKGLMNAKVRDAQNTIK